MTLYGADGQEFGGYFSPRFYNATTANIRLEGIYKRLDYGLKAFIGEQISSDDNVMSLTFGVSPYIKLKINDRLSLRASYSVARFANTRSNLFTIGLVFKI